MRPLLLALLAAAVAAADPVGTWRFGLGTIDGRPARVGTLVLTGQTVVAADVAPLRLTCSEAPGISIIFAAGSSGRLAVEGEGAAALLVLQLDTGAVQVDVRDRGPYAGMRVRGATAEIKVTGTLFTVERVRRDADYVALVRGKVRVGVRRDIAAAAHQGDADVELVERHGVAVDVNGVGTPEALANRPQIHLASASRGGTRDQGLGLNDQGTSDWGADLAGELSGLLLEGAGALGGVAGDGPGHLADGPPPFAAMAEDLVNTLGELGQPPQNSGDTATQATGSGGGGGSSLALPPPPPPAP